ncbi:MAG: glycosyltransferase family 2 protein [Clostridia bacterium]|nr:glycosyltransferase family 2 protein [Clostridia bacterium]
MQFTVIVPIYKVEEYLERCIDSILAQTFPDFEVILVDDGSPDGCPQICDAYAKKDSRVRVIHKPNGGLVSARNAGIFAAKGDYVTYVDGDDWVKPNLLQFIHDRIAESAEPVDMVMFASENVFIDHTDSIINKVPEGWYDRQRLEKEIFPYLLSDRRNGFFIGTMIQGHIWNKPCRRELQTEHYVRDERIRMFTDVPMTYEILLNCNRVYICNEPLYLYNQMNTGSIISLGKMNYLTESFSFLVAYLQERLRGYGDSVDRQLNDYPVHLIIRNAIWEIKKDQPFSQAVKNIKAGLKKTGMLRCVSLKGLPRNPKILVLLFKLHLYTPAMLLCAVKARKSAAKK